MVIHSYPTTDFDFAGWVGKIMNVPDLSLLHETIPCGEDRASDQDSPAHRLFYDTFPDLADLYVRFLHEVIAPLLPERVCAQRVPTFRVSQPGSTAVTEYHRDSDYNHQPATVNFWIPLTKAFGTNTLWVESAPDRGDFRPVTLDPGQMLQFDAVQLRHGNQVNDTGRTRVSFDLRVVPLSQFRATRLRTVTNHVQLDIGEYYTVLDDTRQQRATARADRVNLQED